MAYGIGVILNGVMNYCLKHTIKEPRPGTSYSSSPSGMGNKGMNMMYPSETCFFAGETLYREISEILILYLTV